MFFFNILIQFNNKYFKNNENKIKNGKNNLIKIYQIKIIIKKY